MIQNSLVIYNGVPLILEHVLQSNNDSYCIRDAISLILPKIE